MTVLASVTLYCFQLIDKTIFIVFKEKKNFFPLEILNY